MSKDILRGRIPSNRKRGHDHLWGHNGQSENDHDVENKRTLKVRNGHSDKRELDPEENMGRNLSLSVEDVLGVGKEYIHIMIFWATIRFQQPTKHIAVSKAAVNQH
jgi:hypothetical protein